MNFMSEDDAKHFKEMNDKAYVGKDSVGDVTMLKEKEELSDDDLVVTGEETSASLYKTTIGNLVKSIEPELISETGIQALKDTIEELETTIADLQENKSNNIKIKSYSRDLSLEANESTSKTGSQSNDGYTSLGVMNITCNVPNVFVTRLVADSMTYAMLVTNCNDYDVEVSIGYSLLLVEND